MKINYLDLDEINNLNTNRLECHLINDNYSCNFLYLLFDKDVLVYVGQSMHYPSGRISAHLTGDKCFDRFSVIKIGHEYDQILLSGAEAHLILNKTPKYNKSIPNNNRWVRRHKLSTILGIHQRTLKKKLSAMDLSKFYIHYKSTKYFNVESLRKVLAI